MELYKTPSRHAICVHGLIGFSYMLTTMSLHVPIDSTQGKNIRSYLWVHDMYALSRNVDLWIRYRYGAVEDWGAKQRTVHVLGTTTGVDMTSELIFLVSLVAYT